LTTGLSLLKPAPASMRVPNDPEADASSDDVRFRLDLPHGRCVGIAIRPDQLASILPAEAAHAGNLGPGRRPSFHAGRRALRLALEEVGFPAAPPILPDERGAPQLPAGALGSISHKRTCAVGLAARARADGDTADLGIGVDLEEIRALRFDIAARVLTAAERAACARLPSKRHDQFVLERFSLKEAFWKAVNRVAGAQISFQALEIGEVASNGLVELHAPWLTERGFSLEGWLGCPDSGLILSAVRLRRSSFSPPSQP
jgi:4'-phosphopantetheinyl transferase EntD